MEAGDTGHDEELLLIVPSTLLIVLVYVPGVRRHLFWWFGLWGSPTPLDLKPDCHLIREAQDAFELGYFICV